MKISLRAYVCTLAAALVCAAHILSAQTLVSDLSGVVRDEAGLALPGATVTLSRPDGRIVATAPAGRDGGFTFTGVESGRAIVTAQLDGFRPSRTEITVSSGMAPLVIVLEVAGITESVTVTASREERTLAAVPSSVGVVSGPVLEQARGLNLTETLTFVPGVVAGNVSGVDDLRISIRGAGVRAGFGSRGVVLMADGVPVTEPDGQTPHFDGQIDLANAQRVEVVKGPASAAYGGAALGGVVNVISRPPARQPSATVRVEGGSYRFGTVHLAGSTGAGPFALGGTFGYKQLDGFREHNSLRDWAGTARADWSNTRSRVTLSLLGTDATLELPGTLNRAQFESDPTQSRSIHIVNDWGRENRLFRFGGRYERRVGVTGSIEIDSYGQTRDLFHPIFNVIDQDARRYVGRARYRLTRGNNALAFGVDTDTQWVDDRWFVNVGGRPGAQLRDDDNTVSNVGVYAQDEIVLGSRMTVIAGVRADRLRYDLRDRLPFDGDASDVRTFSRVSPKLGVTVAASPELVFYANVATGFEAPTLGEVRLPAGLNDEVRPQTALSGEAGLRGAAGVLSYDVAVYRMVVDDEILPETIDNVTVYRNVARAGHTGVELTARARATRWLTLDGTYAWSRFTLDQFGVFSGNRLPGIPPHLGTVRATLTGGAWDGALALVASSSTFVNDANTERADAYAVLSGSVGYRMARARLFARADNLGDVRYTNRVQVNDASGFFYYPAPGRNASAGIEVRW